MPPKGQLVFIGDPQLVFVDPQDELQILFAAHRRAVAHRIRLLEAARAIVDNAAAFLPLTIEPIEVLAVHLVPILRLLISTRDRQLVRITEGLHL